MKVTSLYHGSNAIFNQFNYSMIATNGDENGTGIYLASDKNVACMYGNYIYKIDIEINNNFSNDIITITENQIVKALKLIDPSGQNYISNYYDIMFTGYNNALKKIAKRLLDNFNNDIQVISELLYFSIKENSLKIFDNVYKIFKKDYILYHDKNGTKNYIIFSNKNIVKMEIIKP